MHVMKRSKQHKKENVDMLKELKNKENEVIGCKLSLLHQPN